MKQKNILINGFKKSASWVLAHVSWITMTLSPVAMGKEAEAKSVEYYKQAIHQIGLDKKITVREFWEKVKTDLPGYAYFEIEEMVKNNPDAIMPQFDVKSSKASDGSIVPVISFSENGKTNTIQLYNDNKKFMKYNNVVLTEAESKQPQVLFQKLMDNDPKLAEVYKKALSNELKKEKQNQKTSASDSDIKKFSTMNKDLWKIMNVEQRVEYIIKMRQLYLDAQNVLHPAVNSNGKKTSSLNIYELLYRSILQEAGAAPGDKVTSTTDEGVKNIITVSGEPCIVAGYVGQYGISNIKNSRGNTKVCDVGVALALPRYNKGVDSPMPLVSSANETCKSKGASFVACNPIVYSYSNDGSPYCINRSAENFQQATHWNSSSGDTCDSMSRLTNSQVSADGRNKDKYNKLSDEQANKLGNTDLTKKFIENYLKSSGKDAFKSCIEKGVIDSNCEGLITEINLIGKNFETDINSAIGICNAKGDQKKGEKDSNQGGACDQIRKRWLSYESLIKSLKCPEGQKFDSEEKPTKCVTVVVPPIVKSEDKTKVCPKGSSLNKEDSNTCDCDNVGLSFQLGTPIPVECKKLPVVEPIQACSKYPPLKVGSELNTDCTCKNKEGASGNIPKEDQPNIFQKLFNTKANQQFKKPSTEDGTRNSNSSTNNDQQREYSCKFGPNWWVLGGAVLGVGAIAALLLIKTKTKTNTITNTITKEVPICNVAPNTYWNGTICTTPPVTIVDHTIDNTFTCTSPKYAVLVSSNPSPQYNCVCPSCPIYNLTSGQTYQGAPNPITCVCDPAPSEGGSGSGGNGGGSGGVPGSTGN